MRLLGELYAAIIAGKYETAFYLYNRAIKYGFAPGSIEKVIKDAYECEPARCEKFLQIID